MTGDFEACAPLYRRLAPYAFLVIGLLGGCGGQQREGWSSAAERHYHRHMDRRTTERDAEKPATDTDEWPVPPMLRARTIEPDAGPPRFSAEEDPLTRYLRERMYVDYLQRDVQPWRAPYRSRRAYYLGPEYEDDRDDPDEEFNLTRPRRRLGISIPLWRWGRE